MIICALCKEEIIQDKNQIEEDRIKEYHENFPNDPKMEKAIRIVCEDCYIPFKKWLIEQRAKGL